MTASPEDLTDTEEALFSKVEALISENSDRFSKYLTDTGPKTLFHKELIRLGVALKARQVETGEDSEKKMK
jgi:DNA replication initiation complex subunit (GINS family)